MLNATRLETCCQIQSGGPVNPPDGCALWRVNGAGPNDDAWRIPRGTWVPKQHTVFVCISWLLQGLIAKGFVKVNV